MSQKICRLSVEQVNTRSILDKNYKFQLNCLTFFNYSHLDYILHVVKLFPSTFLICMNFYTNNLLSKSNTIEYIRVEEKIVAKTFQVRINDGASLFSRHG